MTVNNTLQISNLSLGYKDGRMIATDLNIEFEGGKLTALVGRNGIGKSTLLRALSGLVPPICGDVRLSGESIFELSSAELARRVSFVSTEIIRVAHLKVWDVVAMGRAPYTGWLGTLSRGDEAIVKESLRLVGMTEFANKSIDRISDGERARVMIGRALAQDTELVLLDEPTAFLDLPNRYQIAILLKELAHKTGKSIIFSTHDLSTALELCDMIWVMSKDGVKVGSPESLMQNEDFDPIFKGTAIFLDPVSGVVRMRK